MGAASAALASVVGDAAGVSGAIPLLGEPAAADAPSTASTCERVRQVCLPASLTHTSSKIPRLYVVEARSLRGRGLSPRQLMAFGQHPAKDEARENEEPKRHHYCDKY